MTIMRKTVLQNRKALDFITASQGGPCAVTQTECCVVIPDKLANVSSLLNHRRIQVNAWSGLISSLWDLINPWFRSLDLLVENIVTDLGNHSFLTCVFSCTYLCRCCGICLRRSQTAAEGATCTPVKALADCSGPTAEEEGTWDCKGWSQWLEC